MKALTGLPAASGEAEAVKRHLFDSPCSGGGVAGAALTKPMAIVKPRQEGEDTGIFYEKGYFTDCNSVSFLPPDVSLPYPPQEIFLNHI